MRLCCFVYAALMVTHHMAADEHPIGSVTNDGAIIAVDSDFIFMEIKPTSLLAGSNAGLGVFAKVNIPPQEILCEYRGAIVPSEVPYESDYIYTSRTATNEPFQIIPDMDKPICSYINDCVVADPSAYTDTEFDTIESGQAALKTHEGFQHNAAALITKMGKVFVISTANISTGSEVFFAYGSNYWLPRLRQIGRADEAAQEGSHGRSGALSSAGVLHLLN
jgi:hypothetical protein